MVFTCNTCESSEYEEVDGLFFCKICCTQSQEYHVQETEELLYDGSFISLKKIKRAKKKTSNLARLGRPWTIYEAYQCIILAQCDALISLGAKEDLKNVVYIIWANYLSKLNVAFCKKEKVVADIVTRTGQGRQRELHRGTLDKPWNRRKYKNVNKRKRPQTLSDSDSDSDSTTFMVEHKRSEQHIYHTNVLRSPEWMDLKKTIVFCYIGLRYTNPEIFPSQFLRWIYEGKIPFMSTSHLLNPDMALYGEDRLLFLPSEINVQRFISEMNKITSFLEMKTIPVPSLQHVISEMVDRLKLPNELKGICKRLEAKQPVKIVRKKCYYKNMDFVAMQYIAFALKMIFGLDDSTEHQLSEYSEDVQKALGSGGNVFIWNEWRSYQIQKLKGDLDIYQESRKHVNYKRQHLDKLLESYHNLHREDRHISRKQENRHFTLIEGLGNPLKVALDVLLKRDSCEIPNVKETSKQTFSESTLTHIVDMDEFKKRFMAKIDTTIWRKLNSRRRGICESLVYARYNFGDQNTLYENRPYSYLWLMELLSNIIGYHIVCFDMFLIKFENRFVKEGLGEL